MKRQVSLETLEFVVIGNPLKSVDVMATFLQTPEEGSQSRHHGGAERIRQNAIACPNRILVARRADAIQLKVLSRRVFMEPEPAGGKQVQH